MAVHNVLIPEKYREKEVIRGRGGNWRSGLGLAYPYFHEDVSVSVPFVWQCLTSLKQKKQKCLCNLRNLWLLLRFECSGLVQSCRLNHTV